MKKQNKKCEKSQVLFYCLSKNLDFNLFWTFGMFEGKIIILSDFVEVLFL